MLSLLRSEKGRPKRRWEIPSKCWLVMESMYVHPRRGGGENQTRDGISKKRTKSELKVELRLILNPEAWGG